MRRDHGPGAERQRLLALFDQARRQLETAALLREVGGCGSASSEAVALAVAMLEREASVPTAGTA